MITCHVLNIDQANYAASTIGESDIADRIQKKFDNSDFSSITEILYNLELMINFSSFRTGINESIDKVIEIYILKDGYYIYAGIEIDEIYINNYVIPNKVDQVVRIRFINPI